MRVTIRIPKILQDKTNGAVRVAVRGATVHECFADLIRQYPGLEGSILDSDGRVLLQWMVYVNDAMAGGSDRSPLQLKDGDTIALLPLVAGG
jgi:molybdopterin synthase sulfur carrier subunit